MVKTFIFVCVLLASSTMQDIVIVPGVSPAPRAQIVSSEFLGITRNEAIVNMGTCVFKTGEMANKLYQLANSFSFSQVPGLMNDARNLMSICESFRALNMSPACASSVTSTKDYISANWSQFINFMNTALVKQHMVNLVSKMQAIPRACVVPK